MPATTPGIERIRAERIRQIESEGYSQDNDLEHGPGELALAAMCYAWLPKRRPALAPPIFWPWDESYWKPTPDNRLRELEKAGALIAAEIDRILNENDQ